jgi:hypothetical protein
MSYIQFVRRGDSKSGLTKIWEVCTYDGQYRLGDIQWYAPWRRYVFYTIDERSFDARCLRDIAEFIEREMENRKNAITVHSS